jgi:hypothetical protein
MIRLRLDYLGHQKGNLSWPVEFAARFAGF